MSLPYKVRFKLPLEFLTLQDWNNFVQNLLFINQYGSAQLLQYYQNGNFQNLNDVIAKYLYVSALKVMGYNVLHNLSTPQAYTFGEGNRQPFQSMSNRPTVSFPYSIPFEFIQFYPISKLPSYQFPVFPVEKLKVQLSQVSKQLQLLIPKLISKIVTPQFIAGTQFTFSGTATVEDLVNNYLNPQYLQTWREIIIQNLGSSTVQINNSIYLMPKNCLKITASSPSEIQLTAQTPTLLSEEIEFTEVPIVTYTITITNSQSDPTPSPFQQLLNLNLSSILSSSSQLLNLEFCLDVNCNTPLYAWIESHTSDLSSVYIWINLPTSIPANSSITIYMFIRNSIQYPYTGMAPTLTSTYAQYDNGENVFIDYWNFAGTSVPNGINVYQNLGSVTFNNGVTIKGDSSTTGGENGIATVNLYSPPIVIDYYGTQSTSPSGDSWGWNMAGFTNYLSSSDAHPAGGGTYTLLDFEYGYNAKPETSQGGSVNYGTLSTPSNNLFPTSVWTHIYTSSAYYTYQNYQTSTGYITGASNTASLPFEIMVGNNEASYAPSGMTVYWLRVRAYPPNGVMPSNSQPQKTIVLVG
ncbi:hypothetical protein CCL42_gp44 [Sulfolobus islandicus rod-shaped virus 8]|uniref:DUF2341 domain-containing protein n=1 Tax=Sulfolobus islandicus rod-shaped virus 8 TaxID=1983551 RepID=A0A1X9SJP9_9VIRU|nr:hypothetical protein CCL42_gp44 [Sulfolobus islandicus rod-shaped virus 8]ARQ96450.1 hypothetical protein [Sulfolobus islandicus rod-shaped virus 8]